MADDDAWSVPGGASVPPGDSGPRPAQRPEPLPPPTGQPHALPPPSSSPTAVAENGGYGGYGGYSGYRGYGAWGPPPSAPVRRRPVLAVVSAVVVAVLVLGGGTAVLLARHRPEAQTSASTGRRAATPSGSPSDPSASTGSTASPPTSGPTSMTDFPPPPTGPPVSTVRASSDLGAMGRAFTAAGWVCVAEHDGPTIGGCFDLSTPSDSARWLGSGDRPDAVRVQVDGGVAALSRALAHLPPTIGWTRADRDAAVAAARRGDDTVDLGPGTGYLYYDTTSTDRLGFEVERTGADVPSSPIAEVAIDATLSEVQSQLTAHGYGCTRAPDGDETSLTCTGGGGTVTAWATGDDPVGGVEAEGSERAIDDMLSLVAGVGGDGPGSPARTIASLVDSVREEPAGVVAGEGFLVFCGSSAPRSCAVYSVSW